nr:DUF4315 family protein [uncultured Butyrivibrio sp.]
MDKATEKIIQDIEKELEKKKGLEERLKLCNDRIKLLEAKKLELENSQIIASIRDLNVSPEELAAFLSGIKAKRGQVAAMPSLQKNTQTEEKAV